MKCTQIIQQELISRGKTLSTAESCTGGRIAAEFTKYAGASAYFEGGIVAYQNWIKEQLLSVPSDDIAHYDVVSKEVAEAMVRGAVKLLHTDYAIATTGYAGPTGGTGKIPVGTIWIACGNNEVQKSKCLHGDFGRENNIDIATQEAIALFAQFLQL